ncbi:hypothetical protein EYF80_059430 [Liparis tanakae]|uniref:Uncharacterized protein n=1 Tax=Liparis tanakae TaxID=230148 RepID=A0A4Z2EN98_9TELE|nr:hypothetical protein EYF80_059430 [Liparis tanakae]
MNSQHEDRVLTSHTENYSENNSLIITEDLSDLLYNNILQWMAPEVDPLKWHTNMYAAIQRKDLVYLRLQRCWQITQSVTLQSETLQSVTLQSVTLQSETLQSVTLQSVTLQSVTLQSVTLQSVTLQSEP